MRHFLHLAFLVVEFSILQIKQAESLFDVVDEEEYAKLVSKRRQDDFVEDDEGIRNQLSSMKQRMFKPDILLQERTWDIATMVRRRGTGKQ